MSSLRARVVETDEGQVVHLPRGVAFPSPVSEVRVHQSGSSITLSPDYFVSGADIVAALADLPVPGEIGDRLSVDIPDRG